MGIPGCESFQPGRTLGYLWVLYFRHRSRLWGTKHERGRCVEVPSFGHRGRDFMGRWERLWYKRFILWILYRRRRPFVRSTCFRGRPVLIKSQGTIHHLLMDTLGGGGGGHCRCSLSCFFFISLEDVRPHGNGSSILGREEETLISGDSSVWDNIRLVRSWYAALQASFSVSPERRWKDW